MAGHPTIGTTFALAHEGLIRPKKTGETVTLGLGIGPVPVELQLAEDGQRLTFAWMTQLVPTYGPIVSDVDSLARCLGLPRSSVEVTRLPVQQVSCGLPYLLVPVATRADVDRTSLD
ncbi:MAG: PhzF family phenazine biosynthesis protein, partial [Acidimicrobiia bacterium]